MFITLVDKDQLINDQVKSCCIYDLIYIQILFLRKSKIESL